ncbi:MAG: MFS transporter [Comamonadaceae bacterium]|nr:MFS transporter [Comamonadaceae bacterium]
MHAVSYRNPTGKSLLLIGILLIAVNLRAPITSLPPLLAPIQAHFGLGTTAAGALTTLPLLAFALLSPLSATLARQFGLERTLFTALFVIALGILLRSADALWCLYVGTSLIGVGIAAGNVLLPSLVKRDFPNSIAALTGAYALSMGIAAALGSAAVVPLAQSVGWIGALASLLILPLAALAVWTTQLRAHTTPTSDAPAAVDTGKVWRSPLAWQVTLFLGLNSTVYYVAIGWLPTILIDSGLSPAEAGSLHGVLQLATAVPGLLLAPLLRGRRSQSLPAATVACFSFVALLGFLMAPQFALIWSILFGIGTGASIILGLSFMGLRTDNASQAAALSGMSQFVGYLLAAAGPMAMGALHDGLGSWHVPLGLCAAVALVAAFMGVLAGRDLRIGA